MLEVLEAPNGIAALGTVWRYILLVHGKKPKTVLRQLVAVTKNASLKETIMTAGEELMRRGERRGERRGVALGEQRALRRTLRKLLTVRFGPLPQWVSTKLDGADTAALDAWTERVLTAPSLEEVLKG